MVTTLLTQFGLVLTDYARTAVAYYQLSIHACFGLLYLLEFAHQVHVGLGLLALLVDDDLVLLLLDIIPYFQHLLLYLVFT